MSSTTVEILPVMTGPLRTGRSSSIDVRFMSQDNLESQGGGRPLQQAFAKLSQRNKSISGPSGKALASPKYEKAELVWRDVDTAPKTGRWRTKCVAHNCLEKRTGSDCLSNPAERPSSTLGLRPLSSISVGAQSRSTYNFYAGKTDNLLMATAS